MSSPGRELYLVRSARPEDAAGIAEVHVLSWQTAYRGLLPQALLDGLSVERRAAQWQQLIDGGGQAVHVATGAAEQVCGFAATTNSRDDDADETVAELTTLYLRPELWGRGVGRQLHAAAVAGMAKRFDRATLWVLDGNARARSFYERQGWRADGAEKTQAMGEVQMVEVRYRLNLAALSPG